MMLEEKVKAVEHVFESLEHDITTFQTWSGLHCKPGCGKCCYKPDISASVLELLPFAYHLYHTGKAYEWLEKLSSNQSSICSILDPNRVGIGFCSDYKYRPLICRLFGFSARTNKYDQREFVTCQVIKTEQADKFNRAAEAIADDAQVPVMRTYYMQLHAIDFLMAQEFFPVNEAIKRAIEVILHYYAYRV